MMLVEKKRMKIIFILYLDCRKIYIEIIFESKYSKIKIIGVTLGEISGSPETCQHVGCSALACGVLAV